MKTSVCITILNKEGTVGKLLESLLKQSQKPDEIIVVDGGSTDRTVEVIHHYQKKDGRIKCVTDRGPTSHGRNVSIELAKSPIVALTDAGCVAKKDWLEKITRPFKYENVGVAAGFYEMPFENAFQEAVRVFLGVPLKRFDPTAFLPSARSVAFRKEVWEKVGGFSEKLKGAGEDTLFFYQCVKAGVKIARVKEARVVWEEMRKISFFEAMKKFYQYAKGDAKSRIWWYPAKRLTSHNIKILSIYFRYLFGLTLLAFLSPTHPPPVLLVLLVLLYAIWSVWKWRDVVKDWPARLWLPVIQIASDLAVMAGFTTGLIKIRIN